MRYKIGMALWLACGGVLLLLSLALLPFLPRGGQERWRVMPPPR